MRKLFFSALAIAVLQPSAFSQSEAKTDNENMVTREVPVSSFDQLKASGVFQLQLSQGDKESVRIEADESLQPLFEVKNEGSQLIINMKKVNDKQLKRKSKMKVYLTFKNLKAMDLRVVGNVTSAGTLHFTDLHLKNESVGNISLQLATTHLTMNNSSVGNIALSGEAEAAVIKNAGVGSLEAAAFFVQKIDIETEGVGNAELNATKKLNVKQSFLGKVSNKGAAIPRSTKKVKV
jgi:hypothetical protein